MNNRGWKTLARALVLAPTGMRPSQMMRLDPELHIRSYLDEDVPMIEVPSGKGGKTHWKPLTSDGVAAFRLFLRVGAVGPFSTSSFYKSWMLACKAANVAPFNPYKLLHTDATLLRRAGADIADIQELLGHKSPKTTQRYAMVVPEKLVAATQRVEKVCAQSKGQGEHATAQTRKRVPGDDKPSVEYSEDTFEADLETEAMLREAIAQCERGQTTPLPDFLAELRSRE
jgi:hypothetical protein